MFGEINGTHHFSGKACNSGAPAEKVHILLVLLIAKPNQTSYRSGCPALSLSEHEINLTVPRLSLLMHATERKTLPSSNIVVPASGFKRSIYCTRAIKLNDNVQMATRFLFQTLEYNKLHDAEGFNLYRKLKMFVCVSRTTRVQFMLF